MSGTHSGSNTEDGLLRWEVYMVRERCHKNDQLKDDFSYLEINDPGMETFKGYLGS